MASLYWLQCGACGGDTMSLLGTGLLGIAGRLAHVGLDLLGLLFDLGELRHVGGIDQPLDDRGCQLADPVEILVVDLVGGVAQHDDRSGSGHGSITLSVVCSSTTIA